jgi:hypothetical protein
MRASIFGLILAGTAASFPAFAQDTSVAGIVNLKS